jgi:hypothetical protein
MASLLAAGDGADMNISALDRPRAPSAAHKRRKTSADSAGTPKKARVEFEPKYITPADRAREDADEGFVVLERHFLPPRSLPALLIFV